MEKISNEDIENKFNFKSSKKARKYKKSEKINSSENTSTTNLKNSGPKFTYYSSNFQNILFKYSGFSSKCNLKISGNVLNTNNPNNNQSNNLISSVKYTPQFKPSKKLEFISVEKCYTPNEKHKSRKSSKRHHKQTIYSLHEQIKSDYKEILKKYIEKPIRMNYVSRKFKLADDYNEINSKKFLYEKDKCLKKMNLTDEIEDEEKKNDKVELSLSPINKDVDNNLFLKDIKMKNTKQKFNIKNLNESEKFLTNFLYSVK